MVDWTLTHMSRDPGTGAPTVEVTGDHIIINVKRATIDYSADYKELRRPKRRSMLLSYGRKMDKLRLEGVILDSAKTTTDLQNDYIIPIRDMTHEMVKVLEGTDASRILYENTEGGSTYQNTSYNTWILVGAQFREVGGYTAHYEFTLEFVAGSYHRVFRA